MLLVRGPRSLAIARRHLAFSLPPLKHVAKPPCSVAPTWTCIRSFHLEGLALAPVVFSGLFVALWTWKCCMLVIFQNKIIFMPGLPPNARWERIGDYTNQCAGIKWREERTRSRDGKDLALCVADVHLGAERRKEETLSIYILYFQGNASSTPPTLTGSFTGSLHHKTANVPGVQRLQDFVYIPTEKGLRLDAAAALDWISDYHHNASVATAGVSDSSIQPAEVLLWGQSIGSGVATNLAAEYAMPGNCRLNSLVLETAFTSTRAMLEVLYPQKWLPYKYLWPFLRSHLDSWKNLDSIGARYKSKCSRPHVFFLEASKDELVPTSLGQQLFDQSVKSELTTERHSVGGAFHNDAIFRVEGRKAVADFISKRIKEISTKAP
ncbi:Alpha/Beta hydrolase protein [Apiospora kogelbergensis]|uniref:Alpha/Beta hydrolase protein n=1 Tax=Apiospora kogelbergensis TaxID=1337665 RepID=A0AAW0RCM6_9PEZI